VHTCTTTLKKFPFVENFKKEEKLSFVSYEKVLLVSLFFQDEQCINKKKLVRRRQRKLDFIPSE